MKYLLSLIICILLFPSAYLTAQCSVGMEARIMNIAEDVFGRCSFDVEVSFSANGMDNSSISFTISACSGRDLVTTTCMVNLTDGDGPYTIMIDDPALAVLCPAEICVTYTGWSTPNCEAGNECTPVDNTVPMSGSLSLPVELVAFSGLEERYKKVKLEWITSSEEQNEYFVVEHSVDGLNFTEIGRVEGNGTTSSDYYYSFWDKHPYGGDNYYRLKQVDFDQSFEYSRMLMIEVDMDMVTPLVLAPSVANNEIDLIFNQLPRENSFIEVFNSIGENMLQRPVEEDVNVVNLDISTYKPGVYYARALIGKEYIVQKFIKVVD